eukprot:14896267-Heterocapsa_arctica.AAC.1
MPQFATVVAFRDNRLKHKKGQKKKMDVKHCFKMSTFLCDYLNILGDSISNSPGVLKAMLELEMLEVHATISEVYRHGVTAWGAVVAEAFVLASHKAIDTEALWAADTVSEELAMTICNSDEAKSLKDHWQKVAEVG